MEIKINSLVMVICNNGFKDVGFLKEYTKTQLVVERRDKNIIIINPEQHQPIIVILNEQKEEVNKNVFVTKEEVLELEKDLDPNNERDNTDLRTKKLSELYELKVKEEQKRAKDLLNSNKTNTLPEVQFGTPNFSKSFSKYPTKKVR